jgi:hypothetical protein
MIDYPDCRFDHYNNPGRNAREADDVRGLCYICLRSRSYAVRDRLGDRFAGTVAYLDEYGEERTLTMTHGFTNAGFNGIVAYGTRDDGQRVSPSAGAFL